ncbi:MAG: hypothetical protein ACO1NZ_13380 [Adhaeribacter sp.]
MARATKSIRSNTKQLYRASVLLFIMLCLLVSCPVKRELKALLLPDTALAGKAFPQSAQGPGSSLLASAEVATDCAVLVKNLLEEAENVALGQQSLLTTPVLLLAFTLASLYLLLAAPARKVLLQNAFAGSALAAGLPLFLRYRQLVI